MKPLLLVAIAAATTQCVAGEFVNLTFDEPDMSQFQDGKAPIEAAFRGWTLEWEGGAPTYWWWGLVRVEGGGYPVGLDGLVPVPGSKYHVTVWEYWQPKMPEAWGPYRPTLHLWQMGLIPTNAWQLSFAVNRSPSAEPPEAYVNGYRLGEIAGNLLDVSRFAGQEVKLEFVFPKGPSRNYDFDIYGFTPIPEPSTWALLVLGAGGLVFRECRRRRR